MWKMQVEVRDEEFKEWLKRTEDSFVHMIETMKDVANVIKENTLPLTPFDEGTLSRSFRTHILTDNSRMKVVQLQMSAINPKDGYNYAWIQHENIFYHHPSLKNNVERPRYLDIAVKNIIAHTSGTNNPTDHFLKEGIEVSKDDAFIMLEEDYLSLFKRGYIF